MEIFVLDASSCEPVKAVVFTFVRTDTSNPTIFISDDTGKICIEDFDFEFVSIAKNGYCTKKYKRKNLSSIVRLLEAHIVGYTDKLSCFAGQEIELFCHSLLIFKIDLYRFGLAVEHISHLGLFDPQEQTVKDGFWGGSGLDWNRTTTFKISDEIESGLYGLRISNDKEQFTMPIIVNASQGSKNRILVIGNVNTWIAYNLYGGRSRYVNNESTSFLNKNRSTGIKRRLVNITPNIILSYLSSKKNERGIQPSWIYENISVFKPMTHADLEGDTPTDEFTNHLAAGEWRLLAWLEKIEYKYDVIADWDIHSDPSLIIDYDVIILSTHCEYWTCETFKTVNEWHHRGGWLLNLSGNTCYSEININKESLALKSFFFYKGCVDESQLFGVRYKSFDFATAARYKILKPKNWVFNGIEGNYFGERSLNTHTPDNSIFFNQGRIQSNRKLNGKGASGWETDKITKTTPKDMTVLAKGQNFFGGADMVLREPKGKRGGYFSASSILFTGALLIDKIASKIVLNVLQKALHNKK